eukprot:COSAG02_NODE_846_length_16565_cov_20.404627_6_plen_461_part_00
MDRSALDDELADFFSSEDEDDAAQPAPEPRTQTGLHEGAGEAATVTGVVAVAGAMRTTAGVAPPPPPSLSRARGVPTLQRRCCEWLARNLGALDDLDDLPEHLSSQVKEAIEADRRLLEDDGLDVWLAAVVKSGATTALCLRWASGLTDVGMVALAEEEEWVSRLCRLDIAFCSGVGDRGLQLVAAMAPQLLSLAISGCRSITDQGIAAVGSSVRGLETMEMEMLTKVSDFGVQALVRGCPKLEVLLLGGCSQLSNISTQLIVDYLAPSLRRLDLGGLPTIIDMDLEDLRRCTALESLSVRACAKLTDGGMLHLATLCKHQAKRATATVAEESESRGGTHAEAGTSALGLASLDLGGLVRLTGSGLSKCLRHATMLTSLDLSGCTGLSAPGFVDAIGALPVEQRRRLTRLTMTGFVTGQSEAGSMLAPTAARQQSGTWAASSTWERLQQLLGPQATITFE